jgi:hypothetical protein
MLSLSVLLLGERRGDSRVWIFDWGQGCVGKTRLARPRSPMTRTQYGSIIRGSAILNILNTHMFMHNQLELWRVAFLRSDVSRKSSTKMHLGSSVCEPVQTENLRRISTRFGLIRSVSRMRNNSGSSIIPFLFCIVKDSAPRRCQFGQYWQAFSNSIYQ